LRLRCLHLALGRRLLLERSGLLDLLSLHLGWPQTFGRAAGLSCSHFGGARLAFTELFLHFLAKRRIAHLGGAVTAYLFHLFVREFRCCIFVWHKYHSISSSAFNTSISARPMR
jgi:hypothetical protein